MKKNKETFKEFLDSNSIVRWGLLIGIMVIFSVIMYPNLIIPKQSYELGDVADRDIKAPKDFFIEDRDATELIRQQAKGKVLTVYDLDVSLTDKISDTIGQAFTIMRKAVNDYKQVDQNLENNEDSKKDNIENNRCFRPNPGNEKGLRR